MTFAQRSEEILEIRDPLQHYELERSPHRHTPCADRWTRFCVSLRGRLDAEAGYVNPTLRPCQYRSGEDGLGGDQGNPNLVHSRRSTRRMEQRTRYAPESN